MHAALPLLAQTAVAEEFLKNGILGGCVVVLATVVVLLYRDNNVLRAQVDKAHEARIEDAKGVTAQLLKTTTDTVTALTDVANSTEAQVQAMNELKSSFKDVSEDIRRGLPRR